jgi:hypothetical protein
MPMTIEDQKAKCAAKPVSAPKRQPKEGSFTEIERAILPRTVIDVLRERSEQFNVWRRYGLSRVYFYDDSWLSYSAKGVCIYGPNKDGIAYQWRTELGLSKAAVRHEI